MKHKVLPGQMTPDSLVLHLGKLYKNKANGDIYIMYESSGALHGLAITGAYVGKTIGDTGLANFEKFHDILQLQND